MSRTQRFSVLFAMILAVTAVACSDDDPVSPKPLTMKEVAGDYSAEGEVGKLTFVVVADNDTTDWLEEGAKLALELKEDGKTTGQLLLPGGGEGGADLDADLAGTWTLKGDTVRLAPTADSFLKDLPLLYKAGKLEGKKEVSGTRIEVVLVREES